VEKNLKQERQMFYVVIKGFLLRTKSYQKPQTDREKSLIKSDKGKYSNIDATFARKATPHAFSL
jgi:hypothetical protein